MEQYHFGDFPLLMVSFGATITEHNREHADAGSGLPRLALARVGGLAGGRCSHSVFFRNGCQAGRAHRTEILHSLLLTLRATFAKKGSD